MILVLILTVLRASPLDLSFVPPWWEYVEVELKKYFYHVRSVPDSISIHGITR